MDLEHLALIALIAALAQTVNQSMGMGYGVITSSLLLTSGMPPAVISATVHAAEVGTSTTGAYAHWRLGNVDRRMAYALAVPGTLGGFGGAVLLSSVPASAARPAVGVILLVLGVVVLVRFASPRRVARHTTWRPRALAPLAAIAGTLDATGGGGWGPVATGTLMARPPAEGRVVVGTVNAAEAAVTVGATAGFLLASGFGGFHLAEVLALMLGGMAVSMPAAYLARRLPAVALGVGVGALLVTLNVRTIGVALGWDGATIAAAMALATSSSLATVSWLRRAHVRREQSLGVPVEVRIKGD